MDTIGILTVLALILAAYRLTRLVTADQFPLGTIRLNAIGKPFWGELLVCPFCVSMWVGGFLAGGQALVGDWWGWQVFVGANALSGVVSVIAVLVPHAFE